MTCAHCCEAENIFDKNEANKNLNRFKKKGPNKTTSLLLNAIKKEGAAIGIKESLAYYRVRKDSISSSKLNLISYNFKVYRDALGYGLIKSTRYLIVFLYEYFFVKSKQTKNV